MDEPNMEADGGRQKRQAKDEKPWKAYPPETYRDTIAELVHFSSKTVNSNAALVGVRLASDDALDAPYVSARTLMARGVSLALDYSKNVNMAGICRQINAVVRNTPFAKDASPEERAAIEKALTETCSLSFSVGVEYVDHRLRQILLPKEGSEGGYVSMTPITAGGICELLFEKDNGLVSIHNAACEEERKPAEKPEEDEEGESDPCMKIRKLRQAQLDIGGSNPQNVGGLAQAMRRPLFVDAPRSTDDLRTAFSFYYKGISLDFSDSGPLRQALRAYADFRKWNELDSKEPSTLYRQSDFTTREEEKGLLKDIAATVLQCADAARELLRDYADMLPQEQNPETGDRALVSPKLKPLAMRALLDPSLRDSTWPRDMAWLVIDGMERAPSVKGNLLLVLDVTATATVAGRLEEAFR